MWQAIQWVTGGTTLAAFIAAVVATIVRAGFKRDEDLIRSVPEADRLNAATVVLERFRIDTSRLNADETLRLALATLDARQKRFKSILVAVIAVVACSAVVLVYALSHAQHRDPTPDTRWFRGTIKGLDGRPAAHAHVLLIGTSCEQRTDDNGYFDFTSCARQQLNRPRVQVTFDDGTVCDDVPISFDIEEIQLGDDHCQLAGAATAVHTTDIGSAAGSGGALQTPEAPYRATETGSAMTPGLVVVHSTNAGSGGSGGFGGTPPPPETHHRKTEVGSAMTP